MLHVETRCPVDPTAVDAWKPGDLDAMFRRVAFSPEFQIYEPVIISRPPEGPWIIMFDNALNDLEAYQLIELGEELGYERSADVGEKRPDGSYSHSTNSGRTSTNAWCVDGCYKDPIAQRIMQRIENITGVPEVNAEFLQLLQYETGQFYQAHNDYIPHQLDRPSGVRMITFYLYLNDVEEGGGTHFPLLGKTISPKRGRAVMWPSVLDHNLSENDLRTDHQAMPVIKGVKYGANAWVHQRDFKTPNRNGC
jgi:prolyl 4-hydroxylase